jgi:Mg2+ and Co2+ transporter CorA
MQPPLGGLFMTGTPRSYALDPDVVRFLDSLPDGRKRPNQFTKRHYASSRSKTVSQAVRAYYLTDQFDEIKKLYKNIKGLQRVIRECHQEIRDLKAERGLLHRLKLLLRKRE